jgi:hypothetical protein
MTSSYAYGADGSFIAFGPIVVVTGLLLLAHVVSGLTVGLVWVLLAYGLWSFQSTPASTLAINRYPGALPSTSDILDRLVHKPCAYAR